MKNKIFSKILSTILILSIVLSVFIPMGSIVGAAAEAKSSTYTSAFNNIDAIKADGWKGFFSKDPQGGVAFSEIADSDYATYYETWGGAVITRAQEPGLYNTSNNWDKTNTFGNMAALTYTARKYKYFKMTVDYKFNSSSTPWPVITFNQQNETPEMFYKTSSAVTSPSYSEDPIGVFYEYEGSAAIAGKKVTYKRTTATDTTTTRNGWRKAEITVTPGKVNLKVYDTDYDNGNVILDYTTDITGSYKGGYITLMQNGVSFFKAVTITELDFADEYKSGFNNIDAIKADGWKGFFSKDPQGGVAFSEMADSDYATYYETWGGAVITRAQKAGLYNTSNNWNNKNTFGNMAALTYTARKYKYFKLTIDYKFNSSSTPWPVITFNQQNETPEMFYKTSSAVTSPSYSEDPIGVFYEYEGSAAIAGKKVTYKRTTATDTTTTRNGWRKAEITVTPGKVNLKVYDTDYDNGNVILDYTTDITGSYKGGYITLMQNGVSLFKNISITELDFYGDYANAFNNVDSIKADGWKGFFSKDPQGGVAFSEIADSDYATYYETWGGAVIARAQKAGLYNTSNNWDKTNTFGNMAALTYTAQKYKYFKLMIDYKFNSSSVPWPVITFNQQNETPEMFYKTSSAVTSPSYSEDPIGVYYEYEGSAVIAGKKVTYKRTTATDTTTTRNGWRKAEITVTPGKVNLKVYDTDYDNGNVILDYTTDITDDYKGGYITLMQNGVSFFKNISIVGLPAVTINDYYTTPDGNGGIADDTIFVERTYGKLTTYSDIIPQKSGYSFMGFYRDDTYINEIALSSTIKDEQYLYVKWSDFADITVDGKIDLKDLVRIKKMAVDIENANLSADLDFDGTNANSSDITVLRKKLMGEDVSSSVSSAAELMNEGMLYPLGRTMVLDGAVEMDHVNTGFVLKGNFEGDVKADFTTNRTGSLLNVSVDGGENNIVDLSLDGLTTLAENLEKGEHTIEVISGTSTKYSTTPDTDKGTQAFDGTLQLNKLYYNGIPATYESDKTSKILFIGDQITCGLGLGTNLIEGGYKESNSYYSYASVLGRMLNAEVEVNARCGAKVCHFVWADCGASNNEGRGKGLCNGIDWMKSINVRNSTEYDYANNQPDIVVINLGTNDIPYAKDENGKWVDIWDDTGDEKYSNDVATLLKRVHNFYPNAKIVWTVGMMDRNTEISQEYIGYFKSYVETWSAANDNSAYFLDLSSVADLSGHNGHPTVEGHSIAAAEIYDFILENNIGVNLSDLAELNSVQKKK